MIPVPWDPIYQRNFSRVITQLGEHYASDPLCVSVVLTCANLLSAEMHLPKTPETEGWLDAEALDHVARHLLEHRGRRDAAVDLALRRLQVDHQREPAAEPDAAARPHRPQDLRDELMQKQAPSLGRIATMVLFALSCFGLLLFLWLSFGGPIPLKPKGYQVKVAFPEATQLGLEADVRVAGVSVGGGASF